MSRFSRMFGKHENTLFYADYGAKFAVWLFIIAMVGTIIYLKWFQP